MGVRRKFFVIESEKQFHRRQHFSGFLSIRAKRNLEENARRQEQYEYKQGQLIEPAELGDLNVEM